MYKMSGAREDTKPNKKSLAKFFVQVLLLEIAKRIKAPVRVMKSATPYSVPIKIEMPCIAPVKKIQTLLSGRVKQKKNKARVSSAQSHRGDSYVPIVK